MKARNLIPLIMLLASLVAVPQLSFSSSQSYQVEYRSYNITFHTVKALGNDLITYHVEETEYEGQATSNSSSYTVTHTITDYSITALSNLNSSNFSVSFSSTNKGVSIGARGAYVMMVEIDTGVFKQIVWAGLSNNITESADAIANSSSVAKVLILNGSSTYTITVPVNKSISIRLNLERVIISQKSNITISTQEFYSIPRGYSNEIQVENGSARINDSIIVTINGNTYAGLLYSGKFMEFLGNIDGFKLSSDGNVYAIILYGENGTKIGFLRLMYLNTSSQTQGKDVNSYLSHYRASELIILRSDASNYSVKPEVSVKLKVNGLPLMIIIGSNKVESTGHVIFLHQVIINNRGEVIKVDVNGTVKVYVVFPNNNGISEVNEIVNPSSIVNEVNVNNSKVIGQIITVNKTGYIMINDSLKLNGSAFTVYKQTPNGLVQLNSTNYLVQNDRIIIIDDPSYQYYVIPLSQNTSIAQQTGNQGTPSSSNILGIQFPIVVIILVIAVVIAIAVFLLRR